MWYEEKKQTPKIDMSIPVLAVKNGETYMLLPQIAKGCYGVIGYNWLNIRTGTYNSSHTWKEASKAISDYSDHDICNGEITRVN